MANPEHVKILKQGVKVWNKWRDKNPDVKPDLGGTTLENANLRLANLKYADLSYANLSLAELWSANLWGTNLENANLSGVDLSNTSLINTKLRNANLNNANMWNANFRDSNLTDTDLTNANIALANFVGVNFGDTNFKNAELVETVFADTNLQRVKNLDKCKHLGPSSVDFQTLKKSWPLPIKFLRGVGFPENFIEYLPSFLNEPFLFYTCFISYSRKDEEFVDRLYADLQNKGIRCWQDKQDMKWGGRMFDEISKQIRFKEKVLLVLSEESVKSDWVADEVEKALEEEKRRGTDIIIPFSLDDAFMQTDEQWTRRLKRSRNIGDFSGWKDHDKYKKAFDTLLKALQTEPK